MNTVSVVISCTYFIPALKLFYLAEGLFDSNDVHNQNMPSNRVIVHSRQSFSLALLFLKRRHVPSKATLRVFNIIPSERLQR